MENFAVIDLGSNSVRMTVNQINDDGSHETISQMKEYVRLSENMGDKKILQPEAIERTMGALKEFKDNYSQLDHLKIKAVATAAVRQASNQKKFLKQVKNQLGLDLEVITGETEAYYDYIGVTETLPATNAVIIDTGGASSEIILVENGKAKNLISLPVGSVTLSQRFGLADEITAGSLVRTTEFIYRMFNSVWWLRNGLNLPIIGLGGSNRTLAKINRRFDNIINSDDIHGYRMSDEQTDETFARIADYNYEERRKVPGINKDRADIIVGGLIPVVSLMRYLDSDRITFSTSGLREGILFEHIHDLIQRKVESEKEGV